MLTLITFAAFVTLFGSIGIFFYNRFRTPPYNNSRDFWSLFTFSLTAVVSIISIVLLILLSGTTQVPANHIAVVENTFTGQYSKIGPGFHAWPFQPILAPFVTKVTQYDLRRQTIEIGSKPDKAKQQSLKDTGVQADSNSPGRPVVYFWARGWAYPNPDRIVELHFRYGPDYLDNWVERVWVSTLKGTQGARPYNFVGNQRAEMENEVEAALQRQLVNEDKEPLVFVLQLAIVDYGFDEIIENMLNEVAQREFEKEQAGVLIQTRSKEQEAEEIRANTGYIVVKRAAEAEKEKRIAEASGEAEAKKMVADADAYQIRAKYLAEAEGIQAVQAALAKSPDAYLEYQKTQRWTGEVPTYVGAGSPIPFFNVPTPGR